MTASQIGGRILFAIGALFLFHAGYSAHEYKLALKVEQEILGSEKLPFDIIFECILGMIVTIIGSIFSVGNFENISMDSELRKFTVEGIFSAPGFHNFSHRIQKFKKVAS
ncbi:hypothetical protein BB560_004397 [Smittium megazygosporum]|uniref:Membrane magnesium transporter n=1 Tax=Smittium megazygosporum TaxID=133381 RepID=A0A2T9Z9A6_9FUNG|nr:hypothetical protein BB560_004397 [Smittium megazygosporum]